MSRHLSVSVALAALVLVGGALAGFAADPPIPIGVAGAPTGPLAPAGQEQVLGAQIAEEFFNKHGGVNGRPIKLVFQDGGSDEPTSINAFQNLINVAKVVGIMGPSLSQQAFAADPFAVRAKVPVIGPSNTAKGIPQIGEFVSRVSSPVAILAPNAVKAPIEIHKTLKKDAIRRGRAHGPAYKGKVNDGFKSVCKEKEKKAPPQFSAQAFAGIQVFVEALRALDKKSPLAKMDLATLRVELNKQLISGTYDTPLGEISFSTGPGMGGEIVQKQAYVAQIKMEPDRTKGTFAFVK